MEPLSDTCQSFVTPLLCRPLTVPYQSFVTFLAGICHILTSQLTGTCQSFVRHLPVLYQTPCHSSVIQTFTSPLCRPLPVLYQTPCHSSVIQTFTSPLCRPLPVLCQIPCKNLSHTYYSRLSGTC